MGAVGRLARRLRGAGAPAVDEPAPDEVVSVVVPVYQARAYLDDCLSSVREQTHRGLQIVVVDDGSTDGSAQVCERHAADDDRILVVRQDNRGLGAARQAGIAVATGTYLTFLDADDTLPPEAYATLVAALRRSGSDFVTGAVQRVTHGVRRTPRWIAEVHDRDRFGVRIDDHPRAVFDVIACNRLFRKDFWDRAGLSFPVGVAYEDHVPMMAAYLRATSFDVLEATTYHWRIREDATSIGQQKHLVENLRDRLHAKEVAEELVLAEASPAVQQAWRSRVLDMDLPLFVEQVQDVDDEYFAVLREGVRHHLSAADDEVLADVRAERRVRLTLVAQDRRADLEALLADEPAHGPVGPTSVVGGKVVADFPGLDLPESLRTLTTRQTGLATRLRSAGFDADGALELTLSALVPYVDLAGVRPQVEVCWVGEDGRRITVEATSYDDPEITRDEQPTPRSYGPGGVRVRTDAAGLAAQAPDNAWWRLEVVVAVRGLVRRGIVTQRLGGSGAGAPLAVAVAGGRRLWLTHDREHGLVLRTARSVGSLRTASVVGETLQVDVVPAAGVVLRKLGVVQGGDAQVLAGLSDEGSARVPLARVRPGGGARWPLRVRSAETATPLAWPAGSLEAQLPLPGGGDLLLRRNDTGGAVLVATAAEYEVREVTLDDGLRLVLRPLGATPPARPVLRGRPGPTGTPHDLPLAPDGGTGEGDTCWRLTVPLVDLPLARWALDLPSVRVRVAPVVLAALPLRAVGPTSRTVVERTREGLDLVRGPEPWTPMS